MFINDTIVIRRKWRVVLLRLQFQWYKGEIRWCRLSLCAYEIDNGIYGQYETMGQPKQISRFTLYKGYGYKLYIYMSLYAYVHRTTITARICLWSAAWHPAMGKVPHACVCVILIAV